jgi:acyl transferase domain-containing protein
MCSLHAIQDGHQQLYGSIVATQEPIAIVGVACRFPGGVNSLEDLRQLLAGKLSAIRDVRADRWNAKEFFHPDFRKPGRIHATRGGFLDDIDLFDAEFFGIAPNEASRMDPQQRLLLETAFEAFEDAGWRLGDLAGSKCAVVVGCSSIDWNAIQLSDHLRDYVGPSTNTGSAPSILANRLSYIFDLRGPSFSVDTACSSSLTALHLACQNLLNGEADLALAAGANLVLKPEITMGFSKGNYLSPDGECRAFSADANGYVRSEGIGVVLLKRLSEALADGDRIHAVIRATALNQDGRTPGMTLPSLDAQRQLLKTAYERAHVDPSQVSYVEAHGTGTSAGDPIEARAIGEVLGRQRDSGTRLPIGSIKSNIGHLESAAGMAGLMKLILVLGDGVVYPNIAFTSPNPAIAFDELNLRVPTESEPLRQGARLGGVNSFGFGGANAHAVVEGVPSKQRSCPADSNDHHHVLCLSARSEPALRQVAQRYSDFLSKTDESLDDICANATLRRSRFEFRLAVCGKTAADISAELSRFAESGMAGEDALVGRAFESLPTPVAFLFSGQGPQWWGMARQLLATHATFRSTVERIDAELARLGWLAGDSSLLAELRKDESMSRMGETQIAQPAIFAVQMGLAAILAEHGVKPAAVLGHSIGEVAAAATADILSLPEAARIVYWRSRCQAMAEGEGAMAAIGLSRDDARSLIESYQGRVEIAAVNGPSSVTIAGETAAIDDICVALAGRNIFSRRLNVSVPFHCRLMDSIEGQFKSSLGSVDCQAECIAFYSPVTAAALRGGQLTTDYWYRNIRQPVQFFSCPAGAARRRAKPLHRDLAASCAIARRGQFDERTGHFRFRFRHIESQRR